MHCPRSSSVSRTPTANSLHLKLPWVTKPSNVRKPDNWVGKGVGMGKRKERGREGRGEGGGSGMKLDL